MLTKIFKKILDRVTSLCYTIDTKKEREDLKMAKSKTRGWYTFEDGYTCWVHGMSAQERKMEILKHGKIIKFVPTN